MKFSALLVCAAALLPAADFKSGQAARASIGQPTFTAQIPGTSQSLLGGVGGVAYANDTLFVADGNWVNATLENNRVLIYQNISSMIPAPTAAIPPFSGICPVCTAQATNVLGQPNYTYGGINGTTGTDTNGNPIGLTAAITPDGHAESHERGDRRADPGDRGPGQQPHSDLELDSLEHSGSGRRGGWPAGFQHEYPQLGRDDHEPERAGPACAARGRHQQRQAAGGRHPEQSDSGLE